MAKKVRIGQVFDYPLKPKMPVAASVTFKRRSGRFVHTDGSNNLDIADTGDTEILGWALVGDDWTSSSTAGADEVSVIMDPRAVFEVPARDTFTAANLQSYIGKTCDLEIASNIQYADNGESNEDVLVIVGGDVDEQTLYVRLNENKLAASGV